jgi:hypothetical protein
MSALLFRVDDFLYTKPEEQWRHNLENFKKFHAVMFSHARYYTLGVIPKNVTEDQLVWLGEHPSIEIAQHGILHDERFPNEFRDWHTEDQIFHLLHQNKVWLEQWSGREIVSYIPPHNVFDRKTVNALKRAGFRNIHCGPGSEFEMSMYSFDQGIHTVPSFPPYYGRSDEMLQRGTVEALKEEVSIRENPFCSFGPITVTLHWTWETNIGLEHLDRFLTAIDGL